MVTSKRFDHGDGDVEPVEKIFNQNINVKRLKLLPQDDEEVWQFVYRKLRIWCKTEAGTINRPFCYFIGSLYPTGQLLNQELCQKTIDKVPSPEEVVAVLEKAMVDPMHGQQRRPKVIVFADKILADLVYRSLEELRIECSVLSEAEGFEDYVQALSDSLLTQSAGMAGSIAPEDVPPLRNSIQLVESTYEGLLGEFYMAAAQFWQLEPWRIFGPRQAVQLIFDNPVVIDRDFTIPAGRVWVCSHAPMPSHSKAKEGGVNDQQEEEEAGLSLFFSRLDLEARLVPLDDTGKRPALWRPEPRCHRTGVRERETKRKLKRTRPRTFDMRSGQEICYIDVQAQKEDWLEVKEYSRPLEERDKGLEEGKLFWAEKEFSMFYKHATLVPFLDLEEIEKQKWPLPCSMSENSGFCEVDSSKVPCPSQLCQGAIVSIDGEGVVWLTRAMKTLSLVVQKTMEEGQEPECIRFPEGENSFTISEWTSKGAHKEFIQVVGSPIIFQQEMDAALEKQRNKLKSPLPQEKIKPNQLNDESLAPNPNYSGVNDQGNETTSYHFKESSFGLTTVSQKSKPCEEQGTSLQALEDGAPSTNELNAVEEGFERAHQPHGTSSEASENRAPGTNELKAVEKGFEIAPETKQMTENAYCQIT